jgi:hypothetical protein
VAFVVDFQLLQQSTTYLCIPDQVGRLSDKLHCICGELKVESCSGGQLHEVGSCIECLNKNLPLNATQT